MKFLLKDSLLLFLLIMFCLSSFSQKLSFERAAYTFINEHFKDYNNSKLDLHLAPFTNRVLDLQNDIKNHFTDEKYVYYKVNIDSIFTKEDYQYLQKQMSYWKDIVQLNIEKLRMDTSKIIISDIRSSDEKMFPSFSTYQITMPIFSKNHNTVILYVANFCGALCGSGELIIMKKQNNSWKFFRRMPLWVS